MKLKVTAFWLVVLAALFIFLQEYSKFHFFLSNKVSYFNLPVSIFQRNWLCLVGLH